MDLVGKTGCNMPGEGLFVVGRIPTRSKPSQGTISSPTTTPALRPSRTIEPNVSRCPGRRRRTTNLSGLLASDCHVPHNCSPMPRVAHTPRRLRRDVCALSYRPTPNTPGSSASAGSAKNTNIVGTNSVNFFRISESFKKRTETNSKRTPNASDSTLTGSVWGEILASGGVAPGYYTNPLRGFTASCGTHSGINALEGQAEA